MLCLLGTFVRFIAMTRGVVGADVLRVLGALYEAMTRGVVLHLFLRGWQS